MAEMMDKPTTKELARFLTHVHITKSCWLWTGSLDGKGYGQIGFRGKQIRGHRFSYRLFVGPIKQGKQILHRRECGRRDCVNPHHLYMGTNDDNMRDLNTWGNPAIGERNGQSKLSESDVILIRKIHASKKHGYKNIAKMFSVHHATIRSAILRHTWKHI